MLLNALIKKGTLLNKSIQKHSEALRSIQHFDVFLMVVVDSSSLSDFEPDLSLSLSLSFARETEWVKAASRSSRRTMQWERTRPMRVARVESFIHEDDLQYLVL
jgi:hypothetical protein